MEPEQNQLDKHHVRLAFEKAAETYDKASVVQQEIGRRNIERLEFIKIKPRRVLDVGSGTGNCSFALKRRYPKAKIIALDIAYNMTKKLRSRMSFWQRMHKHIDCISADAESLPLANSSVDIIFSNLALQWCMGLDHTFHEFHRVLAPKGLLMFSTFGPDTLKELRQSWAKVDSMSHVNTFIDMHDVGDALMRAQFCDPVMDMETITATYPNVYAIMRELKNMGAHNVTEGRKRGLTGKNRMRDMVSAYEDHRKDGVLPLSYEVVYGHAWIADNIVEKPHPHDVATISLDQLRATLNPASRR